MRPLFVEFEEFVRARGSALLRYGYVLTGSAHDAADLVQEILLKLADRWDKVDSPEAYARWQGARHGWSPPSPASTRASRRSR
ncbi:sigma factor [Nonomuraea africana]|uniref:DNA-directed RNA polymerase specialized sigma24 family protein n=1 Tax=Nonomuraea africana TaxID=46171 RepID=A0ABR9KRK1_9ACTN|nr:sigma factor [Nonomuraea africana]MBE1564651.1 DNA-directed RNA polymerase specialized sigma24 family protein [Nonomuraea africana]